MIYPLPIHLYIAVVCYVCGQALTCLAETPEGRQQLQDHVDRVQTSYLSTLTQPPTLMPNTHRRRDQTVLSRRRRRCEHNRN